MTSEEKAEAFREGRYAKGSSGGKGGIMGGGPGGMMGGRGDGMGDLPDGNLPDGELPADLEHGQMGRDTGDGNREMIVGTPDAGTTQAAGSAVDSNNYATYEEMVAAYHSDIESLQAGDEYSNNLVELYNLFNYIGAEGTENPTWVKIICGAAEGDISMFNSLNLQIAMLNSGIDAEIEWQWDGGHVPSEVLGDSFSLYVDQMYGEYVEGAATITKAAAQPQTTNGTATEATGTDLTSWVIRTQRSGSDGERTSSEMSELSPSGGSEGYGACEDDWNPLFVEALQKKPYTEYLLDILLSGSMEERACVVAEYGKEVRKIEQRISEFTASHPAGRHERSRSLAQPKP